MAAEFFEVPKNTDQGRVDWTDGSFEHARTYTVREFDAEAGEFFVKVKSAEEVMEYSLAFLQLYREEAFYLERTVHYLQRVGMDHIKQAVLNDAERRKALHQML